MHWRTNGTPAHTSAKYAQHCMVEDVSEPCELGQPNRTHGLLVVFGRKTPTATFSVGGGVIGHSGHSVVDERPASSPTTHVSD